MIELDTTEVAPLTGGWSRVEMIEAQSVAGVMNNLHRDDRRLPQSIVRMLLGGKVD
jgi:hypothetical protein